MSHDLGTGAATQADIIGGLVGHIGFRAVDIEIGMFGYPGMIQSGMVCDEVEHQADFSAFEALS